MASQQTHHQEPHHQAPQQQTDHHQSHHHQGPHHQTHDHGIKYLDPAAKIPGWDFMKRKIDAARQEEHFKTVGVEADELKRKINPFMVGVSEDEVSIAPYAPQMFLTRETRDILQGKDWERINQLKQKMERDALSIYANIEQSANGEEAFFSVGGLPPGESLMISYNDVATLHIWSKELPRSHLARLGLADDKTAYHVQCGTFSTSSSMMGISTHIWSNVKMQLVATMISTIMAGLLKTFIKSGIRMAFTAVATKIVELAAKRGVTIGVKLTSTALGRIGFMVSGILAAVLFLAINWIFDFLFQEFILVVDVYNFDTEYQWATDELKYYSENATISNEEYKSLSVPPMVLAGEVVTPPGWDPLPTMDTVIGYMTYVFNNHSTFLQGLGMAIQFHQMKDTTDQVGHMQAKYNLRRFNSNQQNVKEGVTDLSTFFKDGNWAPGTEASIVAGVNGKNIFASTDFLNGADSNVYRYRINIGNPPV